MSSAKRCGVEPSTGCGEVIATFTDLSEDTADEVLWNFGDGTTSTETNPEHTFTEVGTYDVTLTRTTPDCVSELTIAAAVEVFAIPDEPIITADQPLGCSLPHIVNFNTQLSGFYSLEWDFGNGETSNNFNPTANYEDFGIYEVSVKLTDANNCSQTFVVDTIEIQALEAQLSSTSAGGCVPLELTLTENSTSLTEITAWQWEVNGMMSTDSAATFMVTDTGTYDVKLIIENSLGCSDTLLYENYVQVGMETNPNFEAERLESCVDSDIDFTDLSSDFVDGWSWNFGDDSDLITQQNPTHSYADTGYYDVTLTTFHNGCPTILTLEDYIHVLVPKADFDLVQYCDEPYKIDVNSTSIGADDLLWDFGVINDETDNSTTESQTYVYRETGTYTVTLTVNNDATGCEDTQTEEIHITDPLADFALSPTKGCVPLKVNISDGSDFADVYTWTAPGGTINNPAAAQPVITYANPGFYSNVQLIVTDINECSDTLVFSDTIQANGVTVDFDVNPSAGCTPLEVNFKEKASTFLGENVQWDWEIGYELASLKGREVAYTFENPDRYPVALTVTNDWGCKATKLNEEAVHATFPIANFSADTISCTTSAVVFQDLSEGEGLSYEWDFGDGQRSNEANPKHLYEAEGLYTVCLHITDVNSCFSDFCKENYIEIKNPIALFEADNTSIDCPSLEVNFTNNSVNATSYVWDFGDGSEVIDTINANHVYTRPGSFDASLIAVLTEACQDTMVIANPISIGGPTGSFTTTYDTTCAPMPVTFTAQSDGEYTYIWDFGNGILDTTGVKSEEIFVYEYTTGGTFTPKLILVDANGCELGYSNEEAIFVPSMGLDFVATDTLLCGEGATITFINLSGGNVPINSFSWLFPNTATAASDGLEPIIDYTDFGLYDVQLIGTSDYCTDTLTKMDYIKIGHIPNANFEVDLTSNCAPTSGIFNDISIVENDSITQWTWTLDGDFAANTEMPALGFLEAGDYEMSLTATSSIGCIDSFKNTITIHPALEILATQDTTVCAGATFALDVPVIFDSTGELNYEWSGDTTLTCLDCPNPVIRPFDSTAYQVVVSNNLACTATADYQVNVIPFRIDDLEISPDTVICFDTPAQLFVNSNIEGLTYEWNTAQAGLSCYDNCNNPIATPESTTTYEVTINSQEGCSLKEIINVEIVPTYQEFAGEDKTICENESTIIGTTDAGFNPLWTSSETLSCTNCPTPTASPSDTTTYWIQIEEQHGCTIMDSVIVNVIPRDAMSAGVDSLICLGEEILIGGYAPLNSTVTWSPAESLSSSTSLYTFAMPTQTTDYQLTIQNGECVLTDNVVVEVVEKTDIEALDQTICEGDSTQMEVIGLADDWLWSPIENVDYGHLGSPTVFPTTTTDYTLIAQYRSCEPDTSIATVTVLPAPNINLVPSHNYYQGESIQLLPTGNITGNYAYEWSPANGLSCTNCYNPQVEFDTVVTYDLLVTDRATGCTTDLSTRLNYITSCTPKLVFAPSAFSPNGDGVNDKWLIDSRLITDIEGLSIFDRWGNKVFETKSISEGWDGIYKGKTLNEGVYMYAIKAICPMDKKIFVLKGDITLLK